MEEINHLLSVALNLKSNGDVLQKNSKIISLFGQGKICKISTHSHPQRSHDGILVVPSRVSRSSSLCCA